MWQRVRNGMQGRVARFRVPAGVEPAEARADPQPDGAGSDRPMPIAASILWKPIDGDAKAALMQGWVVAQDVVHRTGDQLVGWYRGRWSAETGLAPVEAETHT